MSAQGGGPPCRLHAHAPVGAGFVSPARRRVLCAAGPRQVSGSVAGDATSGFLSLHGAGEPFPWVGAAGRPAEKGSFRWCARQLSGLLSAGRRVSGKDTSACGFLVPSYKQRSELSTYFYFFNLKIPFLEMRTASIPEPWVRLTYWLLKYQPRSWFRVILVWLIILIHSIRIMSIYICSPK